MKKNYESPRAERMEFNYTETVVASGKCDNSTTYTKGPEVEYCTSEIQHHEVLNEA